MYGHPSSSAVDRPGSLPTSPSRHARHPSSYTGAGAATATASSGTGARVGSLPSSPTRGGTGPGPALGQADGSSYRPRTSIPAHLQGSTWNSSAGGGGRSGGGHSHLRRGSVVDIAADFLGPAATENLERVRQHSSKLEDKIDGWTRPIRPYLPGIGRFLIVVTFLEDALRILTQITGQSVTQDLRILPRARAD